LVNPPRCRCVADSVSQRGKHGSSDGGDAATHDSNPVRQRLMHMLGLTMPPRTASTATQTAANNSLQRSAGTQTDHAASMSSAAPSSSTSYLYTRFWIAPLHSRYLTPV